MPGARGDDERVATVNVRLTSREKDEWERHVKQHGGYVGALVRHVVNEHLRATRTMAKCPHWH